MKTTYALTIAGSDSGGGAGIQADLRAFHSQGVFGLSVLTAITAQNTTSVSAVHALPLSMIAAQFDAVLSDFDVCVAKTGMLGNGATVAEVTRLLAAAPQLKLVVDPVMIASSGARLLDAEAELALRPLIARATILTPNLPEAAVLLGIDEREIDLRSAARSLLALGAEAVLLKGGHGSGDTLTDVYCDQSGVREYRTPRRAFRGHGTGCSLASLIAARLALGDETAVAVANAIAVFRRAIDHAAIVGRGEVLVPMPQSLEQSTLRR